jgi:uncharacterized protein (TIGR02452 family)
MKHTRKLIALGTENWVSSGVVNERWEIAEDMKWALDNVEYYDNEEGKKLVRSLNLTGNYEGEVQFSATTTLDAIWAEDGPLVALNFASCKKPGGGWRSGAQAQEESLARASGLVRTLESATCARFYGKPAKRGWNAAGMIFSPDVPVFRDEDGTPREPKNCSFITCAAVDARSARKYYDDRTIAEEMLQRTEQVLALALHKGATTLILGAWGTGVFANSTEMVATCFGHHLRGRYARQFRRIVFAIPDKVDDFRFYYENGKVASAKLADKHDWAATNAPRRKQH